MKKTTWLILAAAVLVIATAGAGVTGFLVAVLILGVPYLISCRLHPRTAHRACKGTGRHVSPLYPWANRRCKGCGGGGRQVRHGSRWAGTAPVRAEHQGLTAARKKMRAERRWR